MRRYQLLMQNFNYDKLKKYAGEKLIDHLIEWLPNNTSIYQKSILISIIEKINLNDLLSKKEFMKDILSASSVSDICNLCLENGVAIDKQRPELMINKLVNNPWKRSKINESIVNYLEIPFDPFALSEVYSIKPLEYIENSERFYELFDYQFFIKQRALNILNSANYLERLLIHMPTGTGKTKTASHIICNYIVNSMHKKGLVIWIAHSQELLNQAIDTFSKTWKHLGNGELSIFRLWNNHVLPSDFKDGIVFCGVQKLISIKNNDPQAFAQLHDLARLIIFDEAHRALASETMDVVEKLMIKMPHDEDRSLIGLTATPGRDSDIDSEENRRLAAMFGSNLLNIDIDLVEGLNKSNLEVLNSATEKNIIRYLQNRKILSKLIVEKVEYQKDFTSKQINALKKYIKANKNIDYSPKQLQILAENKARNKTIINTIKKYADMGCPIIVFAISVEHAKILSAMLTLDSYNNSLVVGESSCNREEAIRKFKDPDDDTNIIINYGVLTTGFDSTNIKCVFITRPTKSIVLYSQMVGRGLRGPLMGGNEECYLVDIKENIEGFNNEEIFDYFANYWK
ncbi:DEAD/DEAH box helicase family protein [Amedibacillus dolichus]|uniref:DEAD/DEAH box helicase family protein n=1 Tax=Amedibacillus dolichus TaxID=31971 RepID=A0ABT7UEE5_9FIRM|nr:DEAD/DEAH box helicase family protein [Amedibacillus dolichus]MDM8158003.1 DEAD/DEAH box helicase family protein [Amedibacillus dolichus]